MSSQTSNTDTDNEIADKRCAAKRRSQRLYFYAGMKNYAHINIDSEIIEKLQLTEEDEIAEDIITTSDGRLGILLTRKGTI